MTELVLLLVVIGAVYVSRRIQALERRVGTLERGHVPGQTRDTAPEATPAPQPAPRPRPVAPPAPPAARPERPPAPPSVELPHVRSFDWGRTVSAADLMG